MAVLTLNLSVTVPGEREPRAFEASGEASTILQALHAWCLASGVPVDSSPAESRRAALLATVRHHGPIYLFRLYRHVGPDVSFDTLRRDLQVLRRLGLVTHEARGWVARSVASAEDARRQHITAALMRDVFAPGCEEPYSIGRVYDAVGRAKPLSDIRAALDALVAAGQVRECADAPDGVRRWRRA